MPSNNLTSDVSAKGSSASQPQSRQTPKSRNRSRHTAPSSPLPPPPKLQVPEPPLKYEKMEAKKVNLEQPSLERVNVEKLRPLQAEEVTDESPASSQKPIWRVVKPASLTQSSGRVEGAKSALEKGAQNSHRVDVKKSGPLQATPVEKATGGNPPISPEDGNDKPPPLSPASDRRSIWEVVNPTSLNKTQSSGRVEGAKSALEKGAQNSHGVDVKKSSPLQATPVKKATGGGPSISPHLLPGRRKPVPPSSPLPLPPPPKHSTPKPSSLDHTVEDIINNDGKGCSLSQLNCVKILKGIAERNDLKSKTVKLSIAALKKILQEHDNIQNSYNVITNLGFQVKSKSGEKPDTSAKFNGKEEEVKNWLAAIILLDKNYEEIAKSNILKAYFKTTKKALKARLRLFRKKK